ncbi:fumarylacetoacetate hydrolase family protein [Streptomyces brevispora]|uniref:fumarylacetoacetate hydrolase family protein n=1 Tax=Streptomyces brevispora TaxID=887462 RepID=UPI002DDA6402|nr:fumarylacetoacetate hydrolase family protein [Streptomyces brevispora]
MFVLGGTPVPLDRVDLRAVRMTLTKNGETVSRGTGADCLGSPLTAALWLASTLAGLGDPLRAGDVVLTGALGPMAVATEGDEFSAHIEGLGTVSTVFASAPVVAAVAAVTPVHYGEIVASISSRSAGPGTRANIDEFTETTSAAIEKVGGAARGKAIIVLNPAEPPLIMRDTVHCLVGDCDDAAVTASVEEMIARVQAYVPGYRLKQKVQFDRVAADDPLRSLLPSDSRSGGAAKVSVFLEVEGAAHYLPAYAGNLDIMTSAALRTAERMAAHRTPEVASR